MTIPENYFIYISILIAAIYLAFIIIGYHKGFLYELVNMVYTLLALIAAWFASPVFAKVFPLIDLNKVSTETMMLNKLMDLNQTVNIIAYFLIVFLVLKVLYIFISILMKSINKIPVLGGLNQTLGCITGIFNATIVSLAITMLLSLPLFKNGKDAIEHSVLKYISGFSKNALTFVSEKITSGSLTEKPAGFDIESYREEFQKWLESF